MLFQSLRHQGPVPREQLRTKGTSLSEYLALAISPPAFLVEVQRSLVHHFQMNHTSVSVKASRRITSALPTLLVALVATAAPACVGGDGFTASSATEGTTRDPSTTTVLSGGTDLPTTNTTPRPTTSTSSATSTGADRCDVTCDTPWVHEGNLDLFWPNIEVDNYECLEEVTGSLRLWSWPGTFPQELRTIRRVGRLDVRDFEGESLSGLDCLEEAGGLMISRSANLVDVSALKDTFFTGNIALENNPVLVDASQITLSPSGKPSFIHILDNSKLKELPKILPETISVYLRIARNAALETVGSFKGLQTGQEQASIYIEDNPSLASIDGLFNLLASDHIAYLTLSDLPVLESLSGLGGLREVVNLRLANLPEIHDLSPLGELRSAYIISFAGMPSVTSLSGLGNDLGVEYLYIGDCTGEGLGVVDLSGSDVLSVTGLQLANNKMLFSFADFVPKGLTSIVSVQNPNLSAEDLLLYSTENDVPSTCSEPPEVCECQQWE